MLAELGLDLLDWFRARRPWPQLLRLIALLPDHSHYKVALSQDDELAARQAAAQNGKPRPPRVDGRVWTPERAALTDACDILLAILATLDAQRTGKPRKPEQLPRPVTAQDRYERKAAYRRYCELVNQMTPGRR